MLSRKDAGHFDITWTSAWALARSLARPAIYGRLSTGPPNHNRAWWDCQFCRDGPLGCTRRHFLVQARMDHMVMPPDSCRLSMSPYFATVFAIYIKNTYRSRIQVSQSNVSFKILEGDPTLKYHRALKVTPPLSLRAVERISW